MKIERIEESGTHTFGDNYELIFTNEANYNLINCNITCGNNCEIDCGSYCKITSGNNCKVNCGKECNITCGKDCEILCGWHCYITCGNNCTIDCLSKCNIICGNNCKIICRKDCYIKAGERSQLKPYHKLIKTISKGEQFIWWYIDFNENMINTYDDKNWKNKNYDKWNDFYGFVHNELNSAILF